MSKKKSRRSPSPMEQGELDEESPVEIVSPDIRLEADDSHFSGEEDDDDDRRTSDEVEEQRDLSPDRHAFSLLLPF